jgi:hypothetical protein
MCFCALVVDFDFPRILQPHQTKSRREMIFEFVFVLIFIALGLMPEPLQDIAIEGLTTGATNVFILALAVFAAINIQYLIAFCVFIGAGILLVVGTYLSKSKTNSVHADTREYEDEEDDPVEFVLNKRNLNFKMKKQLSASPVLVHMDSSDRMVGVARSDSLDRKYVQMEETYNSKSPVKASAAQLWTHHMESYYPDNDDFFDPDNEDVDTESGNVE